MDISHEAARLLTAWLERRLPPDAAEWFVRAVAAARAGDVFLMVGQTARRVGKADLDLSPADLAAAAALRPGWTPIGWSTDQAARLVLLLSSPGDADDFARRLEALCTAADLGELCAWYRGLPLYPQPFRHVRRAAEGVRSNMRCVFEAVAHHNPYPAEQFDEGAWNQMILKAAFLGCPLEPVLGLQRRANPTLARMLQDYARERRAAGRSVPVFEGLVP